MLYYDKIDVSEGIDVNKSSASTQNKRITGTSHEDPLKVLTSRTSRGLLGDS